jgi:hypothetical protein
MIASAGAQSIMDNCFANNIGCNLITRENGVVTEVDVSPINLQLGRVNGVDFESEYRIPDGELWDEGGGDLTLHFLGNYSGLANYKNVGGVVDRRANRLVYSGTSYSGGPRWRNSIRATYDNGSYSASITGRYVGGGDIYSSATTASSFNILKASSRFYTDINFQYQLNSMPLGSPVLVATVRNLFDVAPPITGSTDIAGAPTTSSAYDVIGRIYTVGFKFNY